ncbi:MAG: hypothetical protein GF311_24850 [Candidatus Lokiarchaeota archaeon]|nr:hypothetical protein [Candidatus Lokiarchaeota archaeon]
MKRFSRDSSKSLEEIELWLSQHPDVEVKAVNQHIMGGKLRMWVFYDTK